LCDHRCLCISLSCTFKILSLFFLRFFLFFFFFNDPATTEIYTLSLHDALPISKVGKVEPALWRRRRSHSPTVPRCLRTARYGRIDRKSTRLNSSHEWISYAVFCLKKKKKKKTKQNTMHNYKQNVQEVTAEHRAQ